MAITVASSSTASSAGTGSLVITKPTGLAVGDLLVALLGSSATSIVTPAGWTQSYDVDSTTSIKALYKIADSADVSASDFTFTESTNALIAGVLLRVTGHTPSPSDGSSTATTGTGSTISQGVSLTPTYNGTLLILQFMTFGNNSGVVTLSGYTINGTNPTWTEVYDNGQDIGSLDPCMGVAWSVQTTAAAISDIGATISASRTGHTGGILAFKPIINQTISPTVLEVASSIIAPTITGDSNVSPSVIEVASSVVAPAIITSDGKWDNQAKNSVTWNAQDKTQ